MILKEPKRLDSISYLVGRTIYSVHYLKSTDNKIKLLNISFANGDYCLLASDDPRIGVHLVSDTERAIPEV